ncbi:hypothetical protein CHS0354_000576 [Potamilus streckersoni]|uniref:CN hydrolase domain-containing protein n=1 Tax=Potamilus streckersoni TaxID=2493646 RepID=A0AAE0T830_9BIVA|nr:hypothetical protein CHS0354_000576 [Potamilus streckersoni]
MRIKILFIFFVVLVFPTALWSQVDTTSYEYKLLSGEKLSYVNAILKEGDYLYVGEQTRIRKFHILTRTWSEVCGQPIRIVGTSSLELVKTMDGARYLVVSASGSIKDKNTGSDLGSLVYVKIGGGVDIPSVWKVMGGYPGILSMLFIDDPTNPVLLLQGKYNVVTLRVSGIGIQDPFGQTSSSFNLISARDNSSDIVFLTKPIILSEPSVGSKVYKIVFAVRINGSDPNSGSFAIKIVDVDVMTGTSVVVTKDGFENNVRTYDKQPEITGLAAMADNRLLVFGELGIGNTYGVAIIEYTQGVWNWKQAPYVLNAGIYSVPRRGVQVIESRSDYRSYLVGHNDEQGSFILHQKGNGANDVDFKIEPVGASGIAYMSVAFVDAVNSEIYAVTSNIDGMLAKYTVFPRTIGSANSWDDDNSWGDASAWSRVVPSGSLFGVNLLNNVTLGNTDREIKSVTFLTSGKSLDVRGRTLTIHKSIQPVSDRSDKYFATGRLLTDANSNIRVAGGASGLINVENITLKWLTVNKSRSNAVFKVKIPILTVDSVVVEKGILDIGGITLIVVKGMRVENEGAIVGDAGTTLQLNGGGRIVLPKIDNVGYLIYEPPAVNDSLTLSADLTVHKRFSIFKGKLSLNGKKLTILENMEIANSATLNVSIEDSELEIGDNFERNAPVFRYDVSKYVRISRLTINRESGVLIVNGNLAVAKVLTLRRGVLNRTESQNTERDVTFASLQVGYGYVNPPLNTFTTKAEGDWSNVATWSGNQIPSGTDAVEIEHHVTISGGVKASSVTINNGGGLEGAVITSGSNSITVNNSLEVKEGGAFDSNNLGLVIGGAGERFKLPKSITTLYSLDVQRPSGVTLNNNLQIQRNLVLAQGILYRSSYDVVVQGSQIRNNMSYIYPPISRIRSVAHGTWFNSNTWENQLTPLSFDTVEVNHDITIVGENVNIYSLILKSGVLSFYRDTLTVSHITQTNGTINMGVSSLINAFVVKGSGVLTLPKSIGTISNLVMDWDGIVSLSSKMVVHNAFLLKRGVLNRGNFDVVAGSIMYESGVITPALYSEIANSFKGSWVQSAYSIFNEGFLTKIRNNNDSIFVVGEVLHKGNRMQVGKLNYKNNNVADIDVEKNLFSEREIKDFVNVFDRTFAISGEFGSLWEKSSYTGRVWKKIEGLQGNFKTLRKVGSDLWIGGDFSVTIVGGTRLKNVAKYDVVTGSFDAVTVDTLDGTRVNDIIETKGEVFICGDFTKYNTTILNGVGKWNPIDKSWNALGTGLTGGTALSLSVNGDSLYVGGSFQYAGTINVKGIALWNRNTFFWSGVGGGIVGDVRTISIPHKDYLYIGGKFNVAGGKKVSNVARWNWKSFEWEQPSLGFETESQVNSIAYHRDTMYFGGTFSKIIDKSGLIRSIGFAAWIDSSISMTLKTQNNDDGKENQLKTKLIQIGYALLIMLLPPLIYACAIYFNQEEPDPNNSITVSIVQPNINPYDKWSANEDSLVFYYKKIIDSTAAKHSIDLVVLPETAIPGYYLLLNQNNSLRVLQQIVAENKIALLLGFADIKYFDEEYLRKTNFTKGYEFYNSSLLLTYDQPNPQVYHKMKLVPFAERVPYMDIIPLLSKFTVSIAGIVSWGKGNEIKNFNFSSRHNVNVSIPGIICYESIYPSFVSDFVRNGANALSVITNDGWFLKTYGPYQHAAFSRLRAIENRRNLVRCANTGISFFVDSFGNVYGEKNWWEKARAGWSSLAARRAHNPKVVGSSPASATNKSRQKRRLLLSVLIDVSVFDHPRTHKKNVGVAIIHA